MEAGARARRPRGPSSAWAPLGASWLQAVRATTADYVALTKPRVISLLLLTTLTTMFVATSSPKLGTILLTMLGGYLAAGGAGAINHYLEREIDAHMTRTSKRPLPAGRIDPRSALWFGIILGALSFALFALAVNMTAALLSLGGLLGYVFVYTLWLKPMTSQNIVIGGAAGAVPPLVGWAAATGHLDPSAFYLFAIVFYWTPPHFWALALLIKDDYARTGIPMLPVVDGEPETRRQILLYGWLLLAITALPFVGGLFDAVYAVSALALDTVLIGLCLRLYRRADRRSAAILFHYSLAYLALLFVAMAVDRIL
jgi:protoheme IX farnesyltransferase